MRAGRHSTPHTDAEEAGVTDMAFVAVAVVGLAVIALVGRNPEHRNPHVNHGRRQWWQRPPH